jgi:hypothetical protein
MTLRKAEKIFSERELELISQGYRLSYEGDWIQSEHCKTVKLVKYGSYINSWISVDGRFIIEPSSKNPHMDMLYDAYGDRTIVYSLFDVQKHNSMEFRPASLTLSKCLYQSYWLYFLEQKNLLHLVNYPITEA